MDQERTVRPSDFDALLRWLDRDRDRAALRYEEIRLNLIRVFICRGCFAAEDLADHTIDRVMRKLPEFSASYSGNPALYFYGVAKNIYRESVRSESTAALAAPIPMPTAKDEYAIEHDCLDQCMQQLPPESRKLVLSYYEETGHAKIRNRKRLALELGVDLNALRIRVHRIRARLEDCVFRCKEAGAVEAK